MHIREGEKKILRKLVRSAPGLIIPVDGTFSHQAWLDTAFFSFSFGM